MNKNIGGVEYLRRCLLRKKAMAAKRVLRIASRVFVDNEQKIYRKLINNTD